MALLLAISCYVPLEFYQGFAAKSAEVSGQYQLLSALSMVLALAVLELDGLARTLLSPYFLMICIKGYRCFRTWLSGQLHLPRLSIHQSHWSAALVKFDNIPDTQCPVGRLHSGALTVLIQNCFVVCATHVQHSAER